MSNVAPNPNLSKISEQLESENSRDRLRSLVSLRDFWSEKTFEIYKSGSTLP